MTTAYPAALDAYGDPTGAQVQGSTTPTHAGHHTNHNDAIEAIEVKLGIGAGAPPASAAVLRRTGTGSSGWGQIVAGDITTDTITATQIAANAIGSSELADNAVDTAAIVANAVTQAQTAVGSGTTTIASTTLGDMTDMSITMATTGGPVLIAFTGMFSSGTANTGGWFNLFVDGADAFRYGEFNVITATTHRVGVGMLWVLTPSAASHTFKMRWATLTAGPTISEHNYRSFSVIELKR